MQKTGWILVALVVIAVYFLLSRYSITTLGQFADDVVDNSLETGEDYPAVEPVIGVPYLDEEVDEEVEEEELASAKEKMFALLNEERSARGLQPLPYSKELATVAQEKANEMAELQYIAEKSPRYGIPYQMAYERGVVGEDEWVMETRVLATGVRDAHEQLMNVYGMRAIILYHNNTSAGIGVAPFNAEEFIYVQMFTLPMEAIE